MSKPRGETVGQQVQGSAYRVEYRAFCPAARSEVPPDQPRQSGEIVLDCVHRGIERAVGTVSSIKSTIRYGVLGGEEGYAIDVAAEVVGPLFTTPAQAQLLGCAVEDRVSLALLELFGRVWVMWAYVIPLPAAPTAQDATGDVA